MSDINNPGNFFNSDEFDRDDEEDYWKPVKINGRALFKKSIDILNLSTIICDLLDAVEEDGITQRLILENATRIPAKIRGGMAVDDVYCIVMENAVIIKVNICELKAQLWACEELHGIDKKYVKVLRDEIEVFKGLFIQWVRSFDKTNDLPDEWWLFNDPESFPEDE
jgi:hypothetical protein